MQLIIRSDREVELVAETEEEGKFLDRLWTDGVYRQAYESWNGKYAAIILTPNILTPMIGCGGCGAMAEGTPESLPPGWKIRRHRGGHDYRCPNCQKK